MHEQTSRYVVDLRDVDATQTALVGGKGAQLGELTHIDEVHVPDGFCVTTHAFEHVVAAEPSLGERVDRLSRLTIDDGDAIHTLAAEIRGIIETIAMPAGVATAIDAALSQLGPHAAYAVRSSATAEDLPTASFAGQHDSYLGVVGAEAILRHVARCWASLFTERAISYRQRNGIDRRHVAMAVVVQRMVDADAAGVLFTADPITGHRKIAKVEAVFGLGEALVSGRVNADVYTVRADSIVDALGTSRQAAPRRVLTDAQVIRLVHLGRRIASHVGQPQDIEWCFANGEFHIVQSRPITTLFPIPATDDNASHVYLSVGHQQMMTDPMTPLGLSFWQLTTPRPMAEAGGRLFVDVAAALASPASRDALLSGFGRVDPLTADALRTILDRDDLISVTLDNAPNAPPNATHAPIETDPTIVSELIASNEQSIGALKRDIRGKSGRELLDFIQADLQELRRLLFAPRSHQAIMAGMEAAWWLNDHLQSWLGETNAADMLTQSVAHNVTSEMGLALLDVADAIRPHTEVVAFLRHAKDDRFLERLPALPGGTQARDAIQRWLDRYGMRGVGEIDITRPRWSERPTMLLPLLLGHVDAFEPGAAARRFEQGRRAARQKEAELLARLRALPDGARKAEETARMIDRVRTFAGYREYPKYGMVSRYFVYKQALMVEAERLVHDGVLREAADIFYLRFDELRDVVRMHRADDALIRARRDAFRAYHALTPPRVLTSDGEAISGTYRREVPRGALIGLPVSAGTVEGRARVILDIAAADLAPGDILVTTFTDPSWTPLFVAIAALVTEVGGAMTHGAVIAREYGVPAVVGVAQATRLIRDGQRIRVHGTDGYVELLDDTSPER